MYTRREIFLGVLKYTGYGLVVGLLPNALLLVAWATGSHLSLSDDIFKVSGMFLAVCLVYATIAGISLRPKNNGRHSLRSSSYNSNSATYVSSDSYVASDSSSAHCSSPDCSVTGDSGCSISSCD